MISINSSKLTNILGAVMISLLSACGGGAGDGSNSGFTASNTTNTKPQTSSADSTTSSSAESSSSSTVSSVEFSSSSSAISSIAPASSSAPNQISLSSSSSKSSTSKSSSSAASNSSAPKVIIDIAAPSIVPEVTLTFTSYDIVAFSWVAATDNVGVIAYKIYRNQIQIDQVNASELSYADFNVAANNTYTYGVSAGDAVGNWSAVKTIIAKTQPLPTPPSSASSSSQSLSSGSSISASSNSSKSSVSSASNSSTLSTSSTPSSSKSSSSASSLSPDTIPPSAPGSISQLLVSSTRVDIGWTAATDNVGVTTYRIYRDNALLGTIGTATLEYSDKTAAPNKLYTYSVESGDAAGNWSLSRKTILITTPPANANGDVTLYWAPPTQREDGSSITNAELGGFLIRYKSQTDMDFTFIDIKDSSATSSIISNLSGDYVFQIAAYDSNNLYSTFVALSPK